MVKPDQSHSRPVVVRGERVVGDVAVSGVVHVIRDNDEVSRFREGEILVASDVPEQWSHLFSLAKAIITETGELPEHVADAMDALSLPVITGVQRVTNDLRSGDIVMMHVDGTIQRLQDRREPDSKMRVSVPAAVQARQYASEAGGAKVAGGASVLKFEAAEHQPRAAQDERLEDDTRKMS